MNPCFFVGRDHCGEVHSLVEREQILAEYRTFLLANNIENWYSIVQYRYSIVQYRYSIVQYR